MPNNLEFIDITKTQTVLNSTAVIRISALGSTHITVDGKDYPLQFERYQLCTDLKYRNPFSLIELDKQMAHSGPNSAFTVTPLIQLEFMTGDPNQQLMNRKSYKVDSLSTDQDNSTSYVIVDGRYYPLIIKISNGITFRLCNNLRYSDSLPSTPMTREVIISNEHRIKASFVQIRGSAICINYKLYPVTYQNPTSTTLQTCIINANGNKLPFEFKEYRLCNDWNYRKISLGLNDPTPLSWQEIPKNSENECLNNQNNPVVDNPSQPISSRSSLFPKQQPPLQQRDPLQTVELNASM